MKQLPLTWDPRTLARRDDPSTSVAAAQRTKGLANAHEALILDALTEGPGTSYDIAERTQLSQVQVARRMKALEQRGLVCTAGVAPGPTGRACGVWGVC